jgi:hypothetical protein
VPVPRGAIKPGAAHLQRRNSVPASLSARWPRARARRAWCVARKPTVISSRSVPPQRRTFRFACNAFPAGTGRTHDRSIPPTTDIRVTARSTGPASRRRSVSGFVAATKYDHGSAGAAILQCRAAASRDATRRLAHAAIVREQELYKPAVERWWWRSAQTPPLGVKPYILSACRRPPHYAQPSNLTIGSAPGAWRNQMIESR